VGEAEQRLEHLRQHGPAPYAFTLKTRFWAETELSVDDALGCPA